jgi:hypothetical protein
MDVEETDKDAQEPRGAISVRQTVGVPVANSILAQWD